ncbi:heme-binding protein [Novosphingobium sp. FSW06-99]|uniref:GlcG/HbpS family heme-binding protein n=1 Tax=Novosphingobium sp. FSW06-99 TaxID=1739113 RepID=UPI00076CFADA|nr:heme-binding protein [Novosphingobium sp. FSW06-99]KUR80541.1 GlcG protein [Novosphingobium sp. FSW06-99]
MSVLTLAQANAIIAATLAKGRALGLKPLTVAVVDTGGSLIALQRSDASPAIRPAVAQGKASGAILMGVSSRKLGEMAVERPHFIGAVAPMAAHGLVPVAGGVIVFDADGAAIGAVGVSGDTSDNDEICAVAGITAAGLAIEG